MHTPQEHTFSHSFMFLSQNYFSQFLLQCSALITANCKAFYSVLGSSRTSPVQRVSDVQNSNDNKTCFEHIVNMITSMQ